MARAKALPPKDRRRADQYDDLRYDQLQYWLGRDYEHVAELIALKKLLRGKHFKKAIDIGGGYGRLCPLLENYAEQLYLTDPSKRQLDLSKKFLANHRTVERRLMQADELTFASESIDLAVLVRVTQHIFDLRSEFVEIARVLKPDGYAIIEIPNYIHAGVRLKLLLKGVSPPTKPVRNHMSKKPTNDELEHVSHNPYTVVHQLEQAGLRVQTVLSVSNLRSPRIKQLVPRGLMLSAEYIMQRPLAGLYFGPSIFFLVKK